MSRFFKTALEEATRHYRFRGYPTAVAKEIERALDYRYFTRVGIAFVVTLCMIAVAYWANTEYATADIVGVTGLTAGLVMILWLLDEHIFEYEDHCDERQLIVAGVLYVFRLEFAITTQIVFVVCPLMLTGHWIHILVGIGIAVCQFIWSRSPSVQKIRSLNRKNQLLNADWKELYSNVHSK